MLLLLLDSYKHRFTFELILFILYIDQAMEHALER